MDAACVPALIDSPHVREGALAKSPRLWIGWLATTLFALAVGCTAAPLAGKPCPCATGYSCCGASMTCVTDAAQCSRPRCTQVPLARPLITHDGALDPQPDGGPPAVLFGMSSDQQWVSYTYHGDGQAVPTLTMTPDGNGFHVTASLDVMADSGSLNNYAGVGLSFQSLSGGCIDATGWTGVQFDFDGDLGEPSLMVGVVSDDDLGVMFDPRGICTGSRTMCFGPTGYTDTTIGTHPFEFQSLTNAGMPSAKLDQGHIVNVQWQLPPVQIPVADFTISNVQFY